MNNIYKVIWSKAKNCYVVASEIARSHTKSATGSGKIGGVTRRSLLASLMALSLLCGGLGVAEAAVVHVNEVAGGTSAVYTTDETYTKTEADAKLDLKANAADVNTELAKKADAANVYTKNEADAKLDLKANAADVYTKADVNTELAKKADKTYVDTEVGKKADKATTLAGYGITDAYTKAEVNTAVANAVTTAGNNVDTKLADYAKTTYVDTEVGKKADKATTLAGYGITDAYTKSQVSAKLNDKADKTDLTQAQTAIDGLNAKTTKITYDAALGTSVDGVTFNAGTVTGVTSINGTIIGTKEGGKYISQDGSIWANMKKVDTQVETNAKNITKNKDDITALDTKVGTVGVGTYLDSTKSVGENLGRLNAGLEKEVDDRTAAVDAEKAAREAEDTNLSNRIGTVTEDGTYIKKSATNNVSENLKVLDTQTKTNADAIAQETADRKAAIGELAVDGNYIEKAKNVSDNLVKLDNQAKANADEIVKTNERTGGIKRNMEGTQTTIEGKVTVNNSGDVGGVKGLSAETINTTGNATIGGDLKVTGTITTDKMVFGDKATNNYTEIDHGKVTSKNLVVNGAGETISSSSTFNAKENKVGFANSAMGDQSFHKQTSDIIMDNVKDRDNSNNRTQTKTETKDIITDKDGNSSTTSQTASENKTYLKDKDGKNTNSTIDTAKGYDKTIKGENGETSTKQDELNITNTAQNGTITNDAMNIVNNASGNMTNTVGGDLTTTVGGNELHEVTGTKTENVTGKVTENYGNGQETNVTGDQTTNVSGTQTTTATDINRNASSSMVDKVDNAYGTNTETKVAGKTTTDVSIKGTGEKGQYIRGANESRDYLINGTLKNSETKTVEKTSTEITDGNGKTSATVQDVTDLAGSVTNGKETGVSGIHANDDSVSIDSIVTDGNKSYSVINQKKGSIQSTVVDGTNSTVILQDKDNVTIASSNGTVGLVGKDIVNNAQNTITNTAGTSITNQVNDSKVTTDVDGTTFENNTAAVSDGGATTTKINGNQITTGRVDANELGVSDKDGANTADFSVKAGEGVKASAGNGTTTGSLDVTGDKVESSVKDGDNETSIKQTATDITNTAKDGTIKNDAKDIVTNASNSITEKVGETNVTTKTTTSSKSEIQNADTITSVQQTENMVQSYVGKKDGSATNVTTNFANASANMVTQDGQTSTVLNNKDGLLVRNTANGSSFITADGTNTGAALEWTNVKGNEISTGKVEANYVKMDYADVMKDLGVHGNAKVDQNLEVGGTSTLKGDVTMESNATVKKDLKVEGTTTTKTLKVTENAEIDGTLKVAKKATFEDSVSIAKDLSVGGDVTAKSYKVGDKTYIDANGINANDQKITNVVDGSISEGSKDAVNGGQLYGVKRDLEHQVDKVGANAAAMANLRPMEFDPSSKWNIAAAIGNYGSETAAALGAFYRPNDDVMVNLSTAFGTGENMVGGGVSVRLGKGGNKLSREETNALKAQVDDLTARMDALLSVLNPNMSKDFPDVPENHWAYEAVSRLAGNDIVQGYPDGEFHGERTMTRYEMAEIIYNALSRGAEAEKELVEEFKPELQAMAASEKATAEKAEG
ncbi:MAG: ESPR-type extended signal peptide-containing protein [Dialister sp.]|nr:ESPR-type extended signal peptide-containing protein [Dialister sp.]MDY5545241.1 ESPR-type extended signal peptide-containing protein [Dialister sp.]